MQCHIADIPVTRFHVGVRRLWKWNKEEPFFGDPEEPRGTAAIVVMIAVVVAVGTVLLLTAGAPLP